MKRKFESRYFGCYGVLLLLLFSGWSAAAQVVALWPTNYSSTQTVQQDYGRVLYQWTNERQSRAVLAGRVLVLVETTFFELVPRPTLHPRIETRLVYRQIGQTTYRPVGGETIQFLYSKPGGGWVARTNIIDDSALEVLQWAPGFVGDMTEQSGAARTVTTGSPLVLLGHNRASLPYLVEFVCANDKAGWRCPFRFEASPRAGSSREIELTLRRTRAAGGRATLSVDWFTFSLEAEEQPLAW